MTDPLDRAAEALRNAPTPPGPPPDLEAATVAALDASFTHRRNRMRLVRAVGATAALAAAVTIAVVLGTGSPASALDAAVAKARNAKSVKFVNTMVVHHKEFHPQVSTVYYQGTKMRVEEGGHVRVADYATNQGLFLYPDEKYAWRVTNTQKFDAPLDHLNKFVNSRGRKAGADDIAGVKADRYHLRLDRKDDPRDYRLWVDPRTGWLVKVEAKGTVDLKDAIPGETAAAYTITSDRFEWDAPLDAKLFSLDVPPGWEVGDGPPELRPRKKQ